MEAAATVIEIVLFFVAWFVPWLVASPPTEMVLNPLGCPLTIHGLLLEQQSPVPVCVTSSAIVFISDTPPHYANQDGTIFFHI